MMFQSNIDRPEVVKIVYADFKKTSDKLSHSKVIAISDILKIYDKILS